MRAPSPSSETPGGPRTTGRVMGAAGPSRATVGAVYAARASIPRTLTAAEQARVLALTGEHARGYRDHMLFSVVLGTGLRAHELAALDVSDALTKRRNGRDSIELRVFKRSTEDPAPQVVRVPNALRHKLTQYAKWKRRRESLDDAAPLFISRKGGRLSRWGLRHAWLRWRERAEVSPKLTFHALRHTFGQNLYESCGDIEVVRAAMRHVDIVTTNLYARASGERVARAVAELLC